MRGPLAEGQSAEPECWRTNDEDAHQASHGGHAMPCGVEATHGRPAGVAANHARKVGGTGAGKGRRGNWCRLIYRLLDRGQSAESANRQLQALWELLEALL